MKPSHKAIGALAALLLPGVSSAASMQYVVHNGFNETVQALQRLALIVGDSTFVMIAGCLVAGSMVLSSMYFAAEGMAKKANNPFGFLIQAAAGLALFFGAVVPKGTLYVYDDVLNKNQAVGGVPDLIVLVAGVFNAIEREMVRIVDTAAATPYSADTGAGVYQLLYSLSRTNQGDADLERSIGQYVKDCGLTAIGVGQNGASMNELLRSSTDLDATLAEYTHPAWPTTYYPGSTSGGVPGTCADAWTYIHGQLDSTSANKPAAILSNRACLESGFDTSDSLTAARCDAMEIAGAEKFGIAPATSTVFLNNFVIAKGMMSMMMSGDLAGSQTMIVNRNMMAESMGATEAFNQWVPRLRALLMALVLGILPIPLLFLATNLVYKAVGVILGLFIFLTLWGVTDAVSVQMARDAAATVFATVQQQHVGYESMMLVPNASLQALALFGKYRMMAMGLAGLLATALFKVTTSGFANSAEVAGNDVSSKGADAGTRTMTPEGLSSTMGSLSNSSSTLAQVATHGGAETMAANAQQALQSGRGYASYVGSMERDLGRRPEAADFDSALDYEGAGAGGQRFGGAKGIKTDEQESGTSAIDRQTDLGSSNTRLNTSGGIGAMEGAQRVADRHGTTTAEANRTVSSDGKAYEGENTLSRADGGRHAFNNEDGDLDSAHVAGSLTGIAPKVDENIAGSFGGSELDRLEAYSRQNKASQEGLADATGGNVDRGVNMFKEQHQEGLGAAEAVQKHGSPEGVGAGAGIKRVVTAAGVDAAMHGPGIDAMKKGAALGESTAAYSGATAAHIGGVDHVARDTADGQVKGNLVSSRATSDVWNKLGSAPMVKGAIAAKAAEAYRGAAYEQTGGVYPSAKEVAENQATNDVAAARIAGGIGKMMGLNPDHVADRLEVQSRKQGVASMVLNDGNDKAAFVAGGLASHALNEKQADEILNTTGPARVDFTIDQNGKIGAPKLSSASDVATGSTVHKTSGTTDIDGDLTRRGNRREVGDAYVVNSPLAFGGTKMDDVVATGKAVGDLMGDALHTGKLSEPVRDTLAQAYSQRAELQGRRLNAESGQSSQDNLTAGGGIGVAAGKTPSKARPGNSGAGANASLAGQHSESWSSSHSAAANAFTTGMRDSIDSNWQAASADTHKKFGDRSTWDGAKAEEANSYLLSKFSAANESDFQRLSGVALGQTGGEEASAQGHNKLGDKLGAAATEIKSWF